MSCRESIVIMIVSSSGDLGWSMANFVSSDERAVPLLTGLSVGVTSTEADLWLINGTLYVSWRPDS